MKTIPMLIAVALLCGCKGAPPAVESTRDTVLTGVLMRKEWSKSLESWNAGGSEYYVLKVDGSGPAPGAQTEEDAVTLRPSERVPFESFAEFVGRRVTCRGHHVAGERYIPPENTVDQIPGPSVDPITGEEEYPVVGAGFQVYGIEPNTSEPASVLPPKAEPSR